MCFNKEVSLLAFIFGLATSIQLYIRSGQLGSQRYAMAGTIVLLISLMQLIEYFLWTNQKNIDTNIMITKCLHFLIFLQILIPVIMLFSTDYNNISEDKSLYITIIVFFTLFLVCFMIFTVFIKWKPSLKGQCRLNWDVYNDNKFVYVPFLFYLILICIFFYLIFGPVGLTLILVTFVGSFTFSRQYDQHGTFGSFWCFTVIILSIVFGIFGILVETFDNVDAFELIDGYVEKFENLVGINKVKTLLKQ